MEEARTEWGKLDGSMMAQFKDKLKEWLDMLRVPSAKLRSNHDRYKIKLQTVGYRLVYEVPDSAILGVVVAVGKRDRNQVYKAAEGR